MIDIKVELVRKIEYCGGSSFYLPDGVAVFDDGNIVVADSGNDRICLLDQNGKTIKSIGGNGFGEYKFKEPVCGCLNFQFIDLDACNVLYCSDTIGELHSIAYDKKGSRLYVADRSNGIVKVFGMKGIN